jgi:hypothetical protein
MLVALALFLSSSLNGALPTYAAQEVGAAESDQAAASAQSEAQLAADRKGVIWLPHAKWDTASGYDWAGIEGDLQDMSRSGIGWVRIFMRQDLPMSFHDRLVPLVAQYNINLLPIIKKTDPQEALGTPEQQQRYREWLTDVVTRYHSTVKYWEIENETNIPQGWAICCHNDPNKQEAYVQSVKDYLTLLKMAHGIIKGIDPNLKVVIAGLCEAGAERYIEELIIQEAYNYFDIFSYHPFGGRPEKAAQRVDAAYEALQAHPAMAAKPIWITAIGYHAEGGWTAPGKVASEEVKADYLMQTMQLMRDAPGVEGPIIWYALSEPSIAEGYGLLKIDTTVSPARKTYLPAFAAMRDLWVTKFVKILPPTDDTFVSRDNPTMNLGGTPRLKIGYGSDIREAYLRFDLSSLAGMSLLEADFRFITSDLTASGSAATQNIRMFGKPNWTENSVTYRNQPLPVVGTIGSTTANQSYQVPLDTAAVQRMAGGDAVFTISSQSADELMISSKEVAFRTPKLVIYYTTAGAATATEDEVIIASTDDLEAIEPLDADEVPMIEDLYDWDEDDPYSGYPYEIYEEDEGQEGAQREPGLYLPYVEQ